MIAKAAFQFHVCCVVGLSLTNFSISYSGNRLQLDKCCYLLNVRRAKNPLLHIHTPVNEPKDMPFIPM